MYTLQEIFDYLSYGEFYQLAIGGADVMEGIQPEQYLRIIPQINMALTAIHQKLPVSDKQLILRTREGQSHYQLNSKYALSKNDPTVTFKYIMDTAAEPFSDDILRIDGVFASNGCALPLNDFNNDLSLFVSAYDTLQIPFAADNQSYFITYRANHPRIPVNVSNPSMVSIRIPDILLEPLLLYISSRIHGSRPTEEAQSMSITMLGKYNVLVNDIEMSNSLNNALNTTSLRLDNAGWNGNVGYVGDSIYGNS